MFTGTKLVVLIALLKIRTHRLASVSDLFILIGVQDRSLETEIVCKVQNKNLGNGLLAYILNLFLGQSIK